MASAECHSHPAIRLTYPYCEYAVSTEDAPRPRLRPGHGCPVVTPGDRNFKYWRDPVCVTACATYVAYRWLMPAVGLSPPWNGHVTDVLLVPAGLPLWLWLERQVGWRSDDRMPRWREIAFALVTWTVAAELIAPGIFRQATGDAWDLVAYSGGAAIAGLVWQWSVGARRDRTPQAALDGPSMWNERFDATPASPRGGGFRLP